jgi:hypothetical protein
MTFLLARRELSRRAVRCLALGVAILVGGCVYPYGPRYPYPPPYYARPYPSTYQPPPPVIPYPSQPTTMQPPDAYQLPPEPLPPPDIGQSPDQVQPNTGQQEPERLYPEPNNGPPPGSHTILHPFPDMRSP